ncbi:MAG: GAF domain-containing protein, partial [Rhodoferax sp.]|nr:GAF domain-containing protein [Rhodoferax sp.]
MAIKDKTAARPVRRVPGAWTVRQLNRFSARLHGRTSLAAREDFVVQEVARLLRAQRVLLVRQAPDGMHVAASHLPAGEKQAELLQAILPWLGEASRTGRARLRHGPDGASPAAQRSCLVAPLLIGRKPIGFLYGDVQGSIGRFDDQALELLEALGVQVALALDGARRTHALEAGKEQTSVALNTALERQTATAEVLKLISRSTFDLDVVLQTLTESASRFCGVDAAVLFRPTGDGGFVPVAPYNMPSGFLAALKARPIRAGDGSLTGRVIQERRVLQLEDLQKDTGYRPDLASAATFHTMLSVPLLRDGEIVLVLTIARLGATRAFTGQQIDLLTTFGDQAVIAIENVRLFNETRQALAQQTATSDVLRVISASVTDTQPVFDAIVRSCQTLFKGRAVALAMPNEGMIETVAFARDGTSASEGGFLVPWPLDRGSGAGACILDARLIAVSDTKVGSQEFPRMPQLALALGYHSALFVPMMKGDQAIGSLAVLRAATGVFSEQEIVLARTFADQAVIAIENVRLFNETREALDYQTASAEVLKVISESPDDVQPVFDSILKTSSRLLDIAGAAVMRRDGDSYKVGAISFGAHAGRKPTGIRHPIDPTAGLPARVFLSGKALHVPDWGAYALPDFEKRVFEVDGIRSSLMLPMLRGEECIGVMTVMRTAVKAFSEKEIALLQSFVDQAEIAIENVRLFNETREALQQQTASAAILKVISESPTDVQPVFVAIVEMAWELSEGIALASVVCREGISMRQMVFRHGAEFKREPSAKTHPIDAAANFPSRVIVSKAVLHIPDWSAIDLPPHEQAVYDETGTRSALMLPMMRGDECLAALIVTRTIARAFTAKEIAVLQSFVNQAEIAIVNVRLFHETQEALERQTATADILTVISESPTDVQPVFDAIAERARVLCGAALGFTTRFEGENLHLVGYHGTSKQAEAIMRSSFPRKADSGSINGRCILARAPVQIFDNRVEPGYQLKAEMGAAELRSMMAVPMFQGTKVIGAIGVARHEPGEFPKKAFALLKTFADQAAIAIQNVRLFEETQEALEQQTASAEVLNVISSSVEDAAPVFKAIVRSCQRLFGGDNAIISLVDDNGMVYHGAAQASEANSGSAGGDEAGILATLNRGFPRPLAQSYQSYPIHKRRVIHYPDILHGPKVPEGMRSMGRTVGNFSMLIAPMLRGDRGIGTIGVTPFTPPPFTEQEHVVRKTLADQ